MDFHYVTKTFKVIFSEPVKYSANDTYDSIKILSGQTKPSYEEFKHVYDRVVNVIVPFEHLRAKRNELLQDTDWTQTNDVRLENDEEWLVYRKALRDLPANTEDPTKPEWPEPPEVKIVSGTKIDPFATQTQFETTRADLDLTKADLQTTKADLQTTKADLETTKADLETTKTQLQADMATLQADMATLQAVNQKLEARLAFLESALIS